jgi:hypothetical protein
VVGPAADLVRATAPRPHGQPPHRAGAPCAGPRLHEERPALEAQAVYPQLAQKGEDVIDFLTFHAVFVALGKQGEQDASWAEALQPPDDADQFAWETIFVICNSGMRFTVARQIFDRVREALKAGTAVREVFGHPGKAAAIETIWRDREALFLGYCASTDRLAFLETLPWIGGITKYHLAKNFGLQYAKPDVHLQRLADREGCTPQALCERLASASGLKVATVDTILWRACATGVIDSRSGEVFA